MPLIKLHTVPHPELDGGESQSAYIDASRILVITRGAWSPIKETALEASRQALQQMWEEVERINGELKNVNINLLPDTEAEANQVTAIYSLKEAAASLTTATSMVQRASGRQPYHPRVTCTEISLACGTGLEHGVMLSRIWVTETPDEVADLIRNTDGRKAAVTPISNT